MTEVRAVEPESFPWLDYRRYAFSLALEVGGELYTSGQTAATHDAAAGRVVLADDPLTQAGVVLDKLEAILAAAGYTPEDVVHVVEHVPSAHLGDHAVLAAHRRERWADTGATVTTVPVERLLRRRAVLEVAVHAVRGADPGGSTGARRGALRWIEPVARDGRGGTEGPGAASATDRACARLEQRLAAAGLGPADVVRVLTLRTRAVDAAVVSRRVSAWLGEAPAVRSEVVVPRLATPGACVEVLACVAAGGGRVLERGVGPGGSGDVPTLVRAGSWLLVGQRGATGATGPERAESLYAGLTASLASAGAGPGDLVETVERVTPAALGDYREVGEVRARLLARPLPASTGVVCAELPGAADLAVEALALAPEAAPDAGARTGGGGEG